MTVNSDNLPVVDTEKKKKKPKPKPNQKITKSNQVTGHSFGFVPIVEAVAATQAGIAVHLMSRPGNAALPEEMQPQLPVFTSFAQIEV